MIAETPIKPNWKLQPIETKDVTDKEKYQRLMGQLIYLSHTQLDIVI